MAQYSLYCAEVPLRNSSLTHSLNILGKHSTKESCSKTFVPWPPSSSRTPAHRWGFGTRDTFRPLRSGPDQARHLPRVPVPPPRKRDTTEIGRASPTSLNKISSRFRHIIICQMAALLIVVFSLFQLFKRSGYFTEHFHFLRYAVMFA